MWKFLPLVLIVVTLGFFLSYAPTKQVSATQSDFTLADVLNSTGSFDSSANQAYFDNQPVNYPGNQLAEAANTQPADRAVLGATTNANGEEKWIEVDLLKQQATAWEGNKIVRQFLISGGRWAPTPQGTFYIWLKTKSQSMVGGSKELGDYYNLPNVPNNMFFAGAVALHGAYWHNNFGHPMSHGCVNEPLADAEWMFNWAGPTVPAGQTSVRASADNPGTRVWVHS